MVSGTSAQRIRIVIADLGPEGREAGSTSLARALRDAGHEVIYTGLHQGLEQIAATAIQEDADLIGLSVPGDAHLSQVDRLSGLLAERDASDIVVKAFVADTPAAEIAQWVAQEIA